MIATSMAVESVATPPLPEVEGVSHRWVDAGGLRMHVAETGRPDGEPVLLLHGWPQHWYMWRGIIPGLAERYRVIAPDLRGLGWSDAPPSGYRKEEMTADVLRLLDELRVESANLIGHDWGGYVGFLLSILHPERVRTYLALNIIHPWQRAPRRLAELPAGVSALARLSYQLAIITPGVNRRLLRRPEFIPRFLKAGAVHSDAWSEADFEAYRRPLRDPARIRASAAIYRTFLARELVPLLRGRYHDRRLQAPTLLLFGVRDFAMRPEQLAEYEPYADEMRVELVSDSAHFIAEEKPELVARRALEHFEGSGAEG
jgi:pimeloyl-ACP methyl ester carboxylesterase